MKLLGRIIRRLENSKSSLKLFPGHIAWNNAIVHALCIIREEHGALRKRKVTHGERVRDRREKNKPWEDTQ